MKLLIGVITALLFCSVLIWSIEHDYSLLQMSLGFSVFILPVVFFSAIKGNTSIFLLLTFNILFIYLAYKGGYYHVYMGLLLAIIVGFPIHYFKVRMLDKRN
jgi:hypothetical protein